MRFAILSDVHGNVEALQAVLDDLDQVCQEQRAGVNQIWCLGDVVGYGPDPSGCVRRIRSRCDICIAGNHDWAAVGKLELSDFSKTAAASAAWTSERLAEDERNYLSALPETARVGEFTLVHGSPMNPLWEYLMTPSAATPNFGAFSTTFCVVGHTHLPTIFLQSAPEERLVAPRPTPARARAFISEGPRTLPTAASGRPMWTNCERLTPGPGLWMLPTGHRAIVNPGSVGQPRDGDPRASYVIFDSVMGFEFRRVEYDVATTQQKLRETGLPGNFAARLAKGL